MFPEIDGRVVASFFPLSGAPSFLFHSNFPSPNDSNQTKPQAGDAHRPPPGAEHQRQQPQEANIYSDGTAGDDGDDAASSPPPPLSPSTPRRPPPSPFTVFFLTAAMAACSGLGALPYLFFSRPLPGRLRGLAAAAACGVMLAVSFDLIHEGERAGGRSSSGSGSRGIGGDDNNSSGWFPTTAGVVLGALFIRAAQGWLAEHDAVKWASLGGGGRRSSSGNGSGAFFVVVLFFFFEVEVHKNSSCPTHSPSIFLPLFKKTGEFNGNSNSSNSSSGRRARGIGGGLAPSSNDPLSLSSDDPLSFSHSSSQQKDRRKNFLFVAVMAAHALGEGSGVGVSFAGEERGWSRGVLTALAIALHNVPEGLATATALVSRGVRARDALWWTLVAAAPQPLVAVPAFVFVDAFRGSAVLPGALGFAAGCMVWLVAGELLPDALEAAASGSASGSASESAAREEVATVTVLSAAALEALRMWMALWEREDGSLAPPMSMSKGRGEKGGKASSSSSKPPPVVPRSPFSTASSSSKVPLPPPPPSSLSLAFSAALASVAAAAAAGAGAGAAVADATPAGAATLGLASGALAWASSATLFGILIDRASSSSSHLSVLVSAALGAALVAAATSAEIGGPAAERAVSAFQESALLRRRARNSFGAEGFASHLAAPVASVSAFASVSSADGGGGSSFLPTKAAVRGNTGDNGGGGGDSSSLFFKRGGPPPPAAVAAAAGCVCLAMHEAAASWSGRAGANNSGAGGGLAAAVALSAARAAFVGGAAATMSSLVSGRDKSSRTWAAAVVASVGPLVGLAASVLRGGGGGGKTAVASAAAASSTLPLAFSAGALLSSALLLLFPVASSAAGPRVARRTATFGVFAGVVGSVGMVVVGALVGAGGGG